LIDQQSAKSSKGYKLALLFFLGALLAGAAELPLGGWIQIPILSLIWWRMRTPEALSYKNQFISGMAFGLGYFVLGLWWIFISLHDVGGMNVMLSCVAVFLLAGFLALFFACATLVIHFSKNRLFTGLLLAASWVAMEYLRGILFTGFPWMGLGETQVYGPFAPVAPYLGGLGCTFFVVLASWQLLSLKAYFKNAFISLVLLIGLSQLLGLWSFTKPSGEPLTIELIQGNFSQSLVFKPEGVLQQIAFYNTEMLNSKADLVVSPETALPWPETNLPTSTLENLQSFATQNRRFLLFGTLGRHFNPADGREFSNRAIGLSPSNPPYRYDKSHLVPFGEFIPPGFRWFVNAFGVPLSDFSRGPQDQPFFLINREGQKPIFAAITICYEDVFGDELASRLRNSKEPANLLINMTNLAWFGNSQAPAQQLRLSQLRSLETGLPSLRATNTGITSAVGPDGKILAELPQFTQGVLKTTIQTYSGTTPYVFWGSFPILTLSCILLALGFIRQRRI
jgi:apolipoprotein N-acyltransferase